MIWDFRVIRRRVFNQDIFQLHRVFYKDSTREEVAMIETTPATIVGTEPIMMLQDIELATNAFDSPTIYIPSWNEGVE